MAVIAALAPVPGAASGPESILDFRARAYTEAAVATEPSRPATRPARKPLQVVSHRTFINPALDGRLEPFARGALDRLGFRLALRGFYDGVYDWTTGQYDRARRRLRARISEGRTLTAPYSGTDRPRDPRKIYAYQPDPVLGDERGPGRTAEVPFRIDEAFVDLGRGDVLVRLGRQYVLWTESDTIALHDQILPYDATRAIPGVFEDLDEARIPLWTARGTYHHPRDLGALHAPTVEAFLVPGAIDATVGRTPIPTVSPYSPPETDPQDFADVFLAALPGDLRPVLDEVLGPLAVTSYDRLPSRRMRSSRWGVMLGADVARRVDARAWVYRTFAQDPVPRLRRLDVSEAPLVDPTENTGPTRIVIETFHGMTTVAGLGARGFSERLHGLVRAEAQLFLDEPAFVPRRNLPWQGLLAQPELGAFLADSLNVAPRGPLEGEIPHADVLRFQLAFDRMLSRRLSLTAALAGAWNASETFTGTDYRWPQRKEAESRGVRTGITAAPTLDTLDRLGANPVDYVDRKPVELLLQATITGPVLAGRVTPRATAIVDPRGAATFPLGVRVRLTDSVALDLTYVALTGGFFGPGLYRDRDQLAARLSWTFR